MKESYCKTSEAWTQNKTDAIERLRLKNILWKSYAIGRDITISMSISELNELIKNQTPTLF